MEQRTQLLNLSDHRALENWLVVVPIQIVEPGITKRAVHFEDRPAAGVVVVVGNSVEGISEGDVVFFGQYGHTKVTHDDMEYLVMRAEDVYLVAQ